MGENNLQNQSPRDAGNVLQTSSSSITFRKLYRKTSAPESLQKSCTFLSHYTNPNTVYEKFIFHNHLSFT